VFVEIIDARTLRGELRSLPANPDIPNGIVAYDDGNTTIYVPFSNEIDGRVWFFGKPDIDYYLKANPKRLK